MIETQDLIELIGEEQRTPHPPENDLIREYKNEIIKRLRAYDRICHDLKQLIARMGEDARNMSNEVDGK